MPWYVFQLTLQRRSPFRTTRTQYPRRVSNQVQCKPPLPRI
jgi:hypothetical protein